MAKLSAGVLVNHPNTGVIHFLKEGESIPGWAEKLIGDHLKVDGRRSAPAKGDDKGDDDIVGTVNKK